MSSSLPLRLILLLACLGWGLSAADADPAVELTSIRDGLRGRLEARFKADSARESPRVISLGFDAGLGKGAMRVDLYRMGGSFRVPARPTGLGAGMQVRPVDPAGLVLDKDRLAGPLVISWRKSLDQADGDRAEADETATDLQQTFTIDATIVPTSRRLVLTFHRFVGMTLTMRYRAEGSGWVQEDAPTDPMWMGGPFGDYRLRCSPLVVDAAGGFSGDIEFTMVNGCKGDPEGIKAWNACGLPKVQFTGRISEGRVDTAWLLQAPGGKHKFGSGRDLLSGAIQEHALAGSYRSTGALGEWTGPLQGPVLPTSTGLDLLDRIAAPVAADDPSAALARIAGLYRQILVLDLCLRGYPLPIQEAINRIRIPTPVAAAAKDPQDAAYIAGVLAQARACLAESPARIPVGAVRPADPRFGPYADCQALAGNRLPAVTSTAGAQEWRFVGDWRCLGPFEVHDQEVDQPHPAVMPMAACGYARSRLFWTDTRTGAVENVADTAVWTPAGMDGALVHAPATPEFSAGCMRFFDWYATTTITSTADQQVFLAIQLQGQATLWMDDVLVWDSGRDYDDLNHAILPVKLRAGANRLLLRIGSNRAANEHWSRVDWFNGFAPRPQGGIDFTTFRLHLCQQGAPGDAAWPALTAAQIPKTTTLGFRGDGSGIHPDAQPPLAWDLEKNLNVAWKTALPFGTGDMVLKNGLLYVTAEPGRLVCLDAQTGKERWHLDAKAGDPPPASKDPQAKSFLSLSPVAGDDRIYAHFGTGAVLCAGLDGTLAWEVDSGLRWTSANMGSPLLAGGNLVLQGDLRPEGRKAEATDAYALRGLDPATGKIRWTATGPARRVVLGHDRAAGLGNGMTLMRLPAGTATRDLIITADGAVVDAADGRLVLREVLHHEANRAAPAVVGDTAFFAPVMGQEATRFWIDEAGRVAARTLWQDPPNYGRGQVKSVTAAGPEHWMKGPLVQDGRMHVVRVDSAHVPQHYPCPWTQLEIFDTATGRKTYRYRAVMRQQTDPTIPPVQAGKYLIVGDGGDPHGGAGFQGTYGSGMIAMVELGKQPFVVARSVTGMFRASPLPDGNRLFLRQYDSVVCLAVTGDEGRKYQEKVLADNLFDEIPAKPAPAPMLRVTAPTGFAPAEGTPICRLQPRVMADQWLFAGPIPASVPGDPLAALGGPAKARPGLGVKLHDGTVAFQALDPACIGRDKFNTAKSLDLLAPIKRKGESITCYFTVLDNPRVQVLQFSLPSRGIEVWLSGQPLADQGLVHLGIGRHPLLLKVTLGKIPPFVKNTMAMSPIFLAGQDPEAGYREWVERVEANRFRFERILADLPGSALAGKASIYLDQVKTYREQERTR